MLSTLHTPLCDLLGIRVPILQTAMGWVATPELVAASCNAGAMGFLAMATVPPDETDATIARVKQLTDRPFGVNFLMEQPGASEVVDAIIRHGKAILKKLLSTFSWSLFGLSIYPITIRTSGNLLVSIVLNSCI